MGWLVICHDMMNYQSLKFLCYYLAFCVDCYRSSRGQLRFSSGKEYFYWFSPSLLQPIQCFLHFLHQIFMGNKLKTCIAFYSWQLMKLYSNCLSRKLRQIASDLCYLGISYKGQYLPDQIKYLSRDWNEQNQCFSRSLRYELFDSFNFNSINEQIEIVHLKMESRVYWALILHHFFLESVIAQITIVFSQYSIYLMTSRHHLFTEAIKFLLSQDTMYQFQTFHIFLFLISAHQLLGILDYLELFAASLCLYLHELQ